jgi:actin-like ATPase involved in cell morphogenesis
MSGWHLGIDFGTSYTVASVARENDISVIDVESSGRARIPSAVFLAQDDTILVGTAAQHQAVFAPDRFEPTPKRSLGDGEIFLGDRLIAVTDLVAAVLRRVYTEACRQQGERTPDSLAVTHPADWAQTRLAILQEAVEKAGLAQVTFLPEPVAAAARIALAATEPGQRIAVYDFGGGTFDAAVLLRTETGFVVAGAPAGRDPLGGEDIDNDIVAYLGTILSDEDPEAWQALRNPPDINWRRDAATFRLEVQRAKETLSETTVCQLWVPGIGREVQLTRAELEGLIGRVVDDTVTTLEATIRDADVAPDALAGIFLVGGSSRVPLVAETIWRRLGVRPSVQDNPKSVVALGAAGWMASGQGASLSSRVTTGGMATSAAPPTPTVVSPAPAGPSAAGPAAPEAQGASQVSLATFLAMSLDLRAWPPGSDCSAYLTLDQPGPPPLTLRARDEPSRVPDAETLSRIALPARQSRTPGFRELSCGPAWVLGLSGFERRFTMRQGRTKLAMVEQYLVTDGRAVVIACPEAARSLLVSLTYQPPRLPVEGWFESRFAGSAAPDWTVHEQLVLQRHESGHRVSSMRRTPGRGIAAQSWRDEQLAPVLRLPGAALLSQVPGRVFNQLEGEISTVGYTDAGAYSLSKVGVTILGGHGLAVTISLPHADQALFPSLAGHAWLHPNLGAAG